MPQNSAPSIGITCTAIGSQQRPPRLGQNQSYLQALVRAGAAPMLIPDLTDRTLLRTLYNLADGILLPGGPDINPDRFGQAHHETCRLAAPERDETELTLARWAMDDGKPLFAICRGIQVLNVALGGSLYQDIQALIPGAGKHDWYPNHPRDLRPHTVAVEPASRLAHILEATALPVNSLHHQALKDVAPGLTIVARSPDGVIEGVEASDHPFAVAVQWHPEELARDDPQAQQLFDAFVATTRI